ncbi:MAG TPA: hypothetical protein VLM38_00410 [Blastocatellia bacterium]|nr:hypothetical protein [Blastocatellia bacterium]
MFELKPLHKDAIPAALEKAMRYRLLNEPGAAESICLDVLKVDPDNQQALVTLLLAMTDRFAKGYSVGDTQIQEVLKRVTDEYERVYYTGIVWERRAKARLSKGSPGARYAAYDWFSEAMEWFEKAEAIRPAGNDDAILRWNSCARVIMSNNLGPRSEEYAEHFLE